MIQATEKYKCDLCGEVHEDWPALTFNAPHNYSILSDQDKAEIAKLESDFCTISHPDQVDRFIRCTLTQTVADVCQDLDYGLWVSLSEESFNNYRDNFKNESHEVSYFGWLCNNIPGYDNTMSIPTSVYTRLGTSRPYIVPHEKHDHPFVADFYQGISSEEAEARIKNMIAGGSLPHASETAKSPWWKFWK